MVKLFLNYRFYHLLYRANASRREEEKNRKIRWWRTWRKGKLIFFSFFFFWENVLFTSYVIRWCRKTFKGNSQKQPFTDVLQNMYSLCWSLFLIKLQAWRSVFLLKKRFQRKCLPVNTATFLRIPILTGASAYGCFWSYFRK